jgi:hypothetical protein
MMAESALERWDFPGNHRKGNSKELTGSFMTHDPRRPGTTPRDLEPLARLPDGRAVTLSLIRDMEQLREWVLERLSAMEKLARDHGESAQPGRELSVLEESFKKKLADLEESRHQLQAQAEREKHDWMAAMARLEEDRHMLAEAWERIDQERIDALSGPQSSASVHSPRPVHQTADSNGLASVGAAVPHRAAAADSDTQNPVAQAILQQFQTLCGDVRRNARTRRASH